MRFKKGELTKEAYRILMYDLENLYPKKPTISQRYHYNLLKGNIKDIFGKK